MAILVRVIANLSPGYWRVIVGPGVGLLDGGSQQDWKEEWLPISARQPNAEFRMSCFVDGVPQIVDESI